MIADESQGDPCAVSHYHGDGERKGAMRYNVGDRVVKNPDTWTPNEFDTWGRGVGVGVVVAPPFDLEDDEVDVRWPKGRCFEDARGLLPAPS